MEEGIRDTPPPPKQDEEDKEEMTWEHAFYRDRMGELLAKGGDTDTNLCIVGGVLGAYVGFDKLPKVKSKMLSWKWRNKGQKRINILYPSQVFEPLM